MPSMTKQDKRYAKYGEGTPEMHCGICSHYQDDINRCSLVAGKVESTGWCTLWAKKRGKVTSTFIKDRNAATKENTLS